MPVPREAEARKFVANVNVQADQTPRGLVARLSGEAGVDQVEELDRELHLLTVLRQKLVVLDLSAVPYVSSMAMGSLIRFRNEIAQQGGRVVLAALQKNVNDSLRLANLERVLPIYPT